MSFMLQCDDNQLKAVLWKQGLKTDALKSHQPPSLTVRFVQIGSVCCDSPLSKYNKGRSEESFAS